MAIAMIAAGAGLSNLSAFVRRILECTVGERCFTLNLICEYHKKVGGDIEKMKTGKKIAVGLAAALMVAIFAAGAVSMVGAIGAPAPYAVVVLEDAPEVTIAVGDGGVDFAALQKGESKTLSNSLVLTNSGGATAKVEARVIPHVGEVHGLVNAGVSVVLPASNLKLGTTGNEVALADNGDDVDLGVANQVPPSRGVISYDAIQTIPGDQTADAYVGLVELTISAA